MAAPALPLRGSGGVAAAAAKETVEEGEGGRLAVLALVGVLLLGDETLHGLRAAEGLHHLIGDGVQVVVADAHTAHHLVDLRQAQVLGAFQAQALVDGLPILDF